jgi:ActR/RegA family two-component response regulator
MILRRRGYAVSEAATVADAIGLLGRNGDAPQWMLLDLMLPDGCGIDVLRRVRAANLSTRTCVITGCAASLLAEAREAGAEHTFVKPLDVQQLCTVMDGDD